MSTEGTPAAPQYGIKSCGKLAEPPFDRLGPCLLDPDHEGKCEHQAPGLPNGRISVEKVDRMPRLEDHPWYSDEDTVKYRKMARRLFWGSMAAFALNLAVTVWVILRAFEILP